jgi:carnitine monooxygenase subunit
VLKTLEGGRSSNPFPVDDPERVPARRYYDEQFYRLECEKLWPNVWQMACRLEQIPNVGDWVEYSNLGRSVIIVRANEGVKAFHNSCRHRGTQLVDSGGHGNCKNGGFICPFHAWRWNLDGKNTFVYGKNLFSERQLDADDLRLIPCRAEVALGCVFINFNDDAPSFRTSIGPLVDRLDAHGVSNLRVEWWRATVLPANWKFVIEAFAEGYHGMGTHPQVNRALSPTVHDPYGSKRTAAEGMMSSQAFKPAPGTTSRDAIRAQVRLLETVNEGICGLAHAKEVEIARQLLDVDLPEDPAEGVAVWYGMLKDAITRELRARGEPVPDLNAVAASHPIQEVELLFPNYMLVSYFSSFISHRVRPLGPESCLYEGWSLTMFPKGEEPAPPMEPKMLPYDSDEWPLILKQDYGNIPRQQLGVRAKGFEFMRLSREVEGLISNYHRLIDSYIGGRPHEELVHSTHQLAGNFDGRIKDLALAG